MTSARPQTEPVPATSPAAWVIPAAMLIIPALAILIWWLWPPSPAVRELEASSPPAQPSPAGPIPAYVLETEARPGSATPDRVHYRLDGSFEWTLRPEADAVVNGEIGVQAFVFPEAPTLGDPHKLELTQFTRVEVQGRARVEGRVRELGLGPGRYTIALVIGRPKALPEDVQAVHAASDTEGWAIRRLAIEIE